MTNDDRMTWRLVHEVLDVFERHGYQRGDGPHLGRAVTLISDLAHIKEGTTEIPASTYDAEQPSPQADPELLAAEADDGTVTLSAQDLITALRALDDAAYYTRRETEFCRTCADQSCLSCQRHFQRADKYADLAYDLIQPRQPSATPPARQPVPGIEPSTRSQPQAAADPEAGQ